MEPNLIQNRVEIPAERLTCRDCGKKYTNVGNLNKHTRKVHEGNKPHECYLCNETFKKEIDLKKHLVGNHEMEKPYDCGIGNCDKSYKDKKSMVRHQIKVHQFTTK